MIPAHSDGDTIAAIATPPGRGGISIVRISGPDSGAILASVFSGRCDPRLNDRVMVYGHIMRGTKTIDEVLAVYMQAPHSYTGEHVAEIQSHGGYAAADAILSLVVDKGARLSAPGEFTKRAFMNGKIDLAQAEAVMEIVSAVSREHLAQAEHLFEGVFSQKIRGLHDTIQHTLSILEYNIDFAEEHTSHETHDDIHRQIESILTTITSLIASYTIAQKIKDGISVILAGEVNAGKSSLFNAILGTKRAIVNSRPGTTRDWLEARLEIGGHTINLIDTAGLRSTDDEIEMEGVNETKRLIQNADIVIRLHNAESLSSSIHTDDFSKSTVIDIISKADLLTDTPETYPINMLPVSSKTRKGLDTLLTTLSETVQSSTQTNSTDSLVLIDRHKKELLAARTHISYALSAMNDWSEEVISYELSETSQHLSAILGENIDIDVLDRIFASFCIGK